MLVWFHGGGLSTGQGDDMPLAVTVAQSPAAGDMYGPQFLIEYNLVIVTVNYRLGPLGQLSLDTGLVSGNQVQGGWRVPRLTSCTQGLRDQQLALHWVQENILHFGGDAARVTIAGESAGSWSILHHILAPGSRGLFR